MTGRAEFITVIDDLTDTEVLVNLSHINEVLPNGENTCMLVFTTHNRVIKETLTSFQTRIVDTQIRNKALLRG